MRKVRKRLLVFEYNNLFKSRPFFIDMVYEMIITALDTEIRGYLEMAERVLQDFGFGCKVHIIPNIFGVNGEGEACSLYDPEIIVINRDIPKEVFYSGLLSNPRADMKDCLTTAARTIKTDLEDVVLTK